jgi:hypothetical protein
MKAVQIGDLRHGSVLTGKNGKYEIESVVLNPDGVLVAVRGVSRKLRRCMHGGFDVGMEDMDRIAAQWLRMRGKSKAGKTDMEGVRRAAALLLEELREVGL